MKSNKSLSFAMKRIRKNVRTHLATGGDKCTASNITLAPTCKTNDSKVPPPPHCPGYTYDSL